MGKRIKTKYPGVFYREVPRRGRQGIERVYYIVFKSDGKVHEEKVGRQYEDAMTPAKAALKRGERIEGKRKSRKEIRLEQKRRKEAELNKWTINRLWEEYKTANPHLKGIVQDQNRFKLYLKDRFGKKEPHELNSFEVEKLRLNLLKNKKEATVRNILELLRRIINFGIKRGVCNDINFAIKMPRVNNEKTETLTPQQLRNLLDAIDADENIQAANLMKLVLYTGMRRGELFRLKWEHINFEYKFIRIVDPKGGIDQKIPLNSHAEQLLLNHPRSDSPYVFPGKNGQQRRDIKRPVNRIKKRAGLPDDFRALHGLRHVFASNLASSGKVSMYTLQKLLTHKSPQMTQRYAHLSDEALMSAANLAGDIVNESIQGDLQMNDEQSVG